ncbi:MAG: MGMT family protein [Chloroflexota bacterium]|nr:MGMT family protein [Chloroflexota bacterium]
MSFRRAVLEVVSRIPPGRVTTYGRISRSLGFPRRARHVGMALAQSSEIGEFPCHRVVNRDGELSGGWAFGHPVVMRQLLEEEGVPFLAETRVDLDTCLWEPPDLSELLRQPETEPARQDREAESPSGPG